MSARVQAVDVFRASKWIAEHGGGADEEAALRQAFADARAAEREACAKAAEAVQPILGAPNPVAVACAIAVRART